MYYFQRQIKYQQFKKKKNSTEDWSSVSNSKSFGNSIAWNVSRWCWLGSQRDTVRTAANDLGLGCKVWDFRGLRFGWGLNKTNCRMTGCLSQSGHTVLTPALTDRGHFSQLAWTVLISAWSHQYFNSRLPLEFFWTYRDKMFTSKLYKGTIILMFNMLQKEV